MDGAALYSFLSTIEEVDKEDDGKDVLAHDDGGNDDHAGDAGYIRSKSG